MMSSTSARKRADDTIYEESFANPQYEKGRKNVPEAELEHVSPIRPVQQPENPDQNLHAQMDVKTIKNQVAQHLQKISEDLNQIADLASEIEQEKETIKQVLHDLPT